jgi:signal transduction histidine kinase
MTIYTSSEQPDLAGQDPPDSTQANGRDIAYEPGDGETMRQLAHDLRQPVAAIRALAAAAAADGQASDAIVQRLRQISDQAGWISLAIDDLLTDGSGTRDANRPELLQVCTLVRDAVVTERLTYRGAITVSHDATAAAGHVLASPTRLRRALANVVANATRAAGPTGTVQLTERTDSGWIIVEIADDGPGFGHVGPVHGIGLQITRRVLAECRGRMEIERRPEGQTVVRLILPMVPGTTGDDSR